MVRALLIVDVQNDFIPGGALPTRDGGDVVPVINRLQKDFSLVVATQDWHPQNHGSFASNHPGTKPGEMIELGGLPQVLWPDHCVQGSWGAEFHPNLETRRVAKVIRKGTDPEIDSYSGFFDNGRRKATGLEQYLRDQEVTEIFISGLATDYCVLWTARDAKSLGFETHVIADACRGVELKPGDIDRAIEEMRSLSVGVLTAESVEKR
jgi:nicotinamidase/pyrazinamidase